MMIFVRLFTLVCFLAFCSAFNNDLIPEALREFNLHNDVAVDPLALKGEENSYTQPSTNRKSSGDSPSGCPKSEILQSLMKILLRLSKQMEKDAAPNRDQLSEAIALYKKYLLTAKLTKENFALLKKLLTVERDLTKPSKQIEEAKLIVTLELPVPSQPLCLNALEDIVKTAQNAYAALKSNHLCGRSKSLEESVTSLTNTEDRVPTLQDLLTSTGKSPLSIGSTGFDIFNYLNNYRPGGINPQALNEPYVNNGLWSKLLKDPKLKDLSASGISNDLISQVLQNENNVNDEDYEQKNLLPQFNPKRKKTKQPTETQNDLLSNLLNKIITNDSKVLKFDIPNSQNNRPSSINPNINKILQENLVYGKGNSGPNALNIEHVPPLGEVDPTQDLLSKLLPSQDQTSISMSKTSYPNPLQDPPSVIEAVDKLKSDQVPDILKPNLQDLNTIQFDKNKLPHDTNALSRILNKLKYATILGSNLNKQKKKQNQQSNSFLDQSNWTNNDFSTSFLNDIPQKALHADNVIPNFNNDKVSHSSKVSIHVTPYLNPTHINVLDQRPPEFDDRIVDVPENVYKLVTEPNQTGVLELSYLLNRPKPMSEPFYFVKYKIPYETFALNFQKLLKEEPLKTRSPEMFYKDLLIKSSSDIADSSNVLRTPLNKNIIEQVLKNGTLLDAKVIDDNSTHKFVEVSVKALPNDDEVVQLVDNLDHQKVIQTKTFKVPSADENRGVKKYKNSYRSNGFRNYDKDDASKSLAAMDELRYKLKEISSPNFLQLHSDSAKGINSPTTAPAPPTNSEEK